MNDRLAPAHGGVAPGQVAEIIATVDGAAGRRGSRYRVGPTAVLTIAPREGEPPVTVARCGRISDRAAVLTVQAVGFPRFKLKTDDGDRSVYRDSHQAHGSVAVLSNRREGTLEVTVPPPERDPDPAVSPWEGMSGAAVWVGDRIVGVIATHHRSDGLGRLAAARLDLAFEGLDASRRAELCALLGLPDVVPDVVPPSVSELVTTAYQAQVRDIAPDRLLDREEELDELVGFCAGDQPYAWWQAGPWAGKSALMAWFVLRPPAGVDVVSFFITARLAGQSDSDACTDALIEQLAALLGESPTGLLTTRTRRGTMLRLLEDAANRSREAGRRLLLVIDGLDEDSGTGSSIAALLPRRPPPEVRVLVASRPHPPVPDDVADDHPLRTISPRQLDVSEHARSVERRAKHELTQLLTGSQLQRDVLGFITASGGGLTLGDLEQLTERPPFEIEPLLGGVFGRTVGSRIATLSAKYPSERMYLFTHETLRLVAEQQYGTSLIAYRDQLHAWADTYRQRGWPADTSHYLLRGYPRMLASSGDLPRLVACATDQVRHDRIRDLTGGDALAVAEISTAQQLILAQPNPDLTSLAFLAVQRDHLSERNDNLPIELPAVWARLGQPTRAEALANGITYPYRRGQALVGVLKVVAAGGDHDRAARLAGDTEALVGKITIWERREAPLNLLAEAMTAAGKHDQAEVFIGQIADPNQRARELSRLAEAMVVAGDYKRAEELAAQISAEPDWEIAALARLADAMAAMGRHDRTSQLIDEAEKLARQVSWPDEQALALAELTEAVAATGNHDRANQMADKAERLTRRIPDLSSRTSMLALLAKVAAATGNLRRATRLGGEAETLLAQIADPADRELVLSTLAQASAAAGNHDRAEALTREIPYAAWRANGLARVAEVVAAAGDHDRAARLAGEAEALAIQANKRHRQLEALAQLTEALAATGNHERARQLADKAETLTGSIPELSDQCWALSQLAKAVDAAGDRDRAEELVRQIAVSGPPCSGAGSARGGGGRRW